MCCSEEDLDSILARYREAAAGMRQRNPEKANKSHDEMHACYKLLRETDAGRQRVASLLSDPDPYVRCSAAAHSLQWFPEVARRVLQELQDADGESAFDAKMILQEFDKGRLSFDY